MRNDMPQFAIYLGICVGLVCLAGLMAGSTMGLLSLDKLNLAILEMEGTDAEKRSARRVGPLLQRHHLLLVTLLLCNAAANEALPIFLDKLVDPLTAVIISVTCVLFFGEIIPSAIFTGPNQLHIGARLAPIVTVLMYLTYPLSYPISKLLDKILGEDEDMTRYGRNQLKALVQLQRKQHETLRRIRAESQRGAKNLDSYKHDHLLSVDEVTIIHGALDLKSKSVADAMTPWMGVFRLPINAPLSSDTLAEIMAHGHSRVPVYEGMEDNIVGILKVKKLIVVDPTQERPIAELALRKPLVVGPGLPLFTMLNVFQEGRSHLALVTREYDDVALCWAEGKPLDTTKVKILGIITLEDVLEELIQEEIEDEDDIGMGAVFHTRNTEPTLGVSQSRLDRASTLEQLQNPVVRKAADKFLSLLVHRSGADGAGAEEDSGASGITKPLEFPAQLPAASLRPIAIRRQTSAPARTQSAGTTSTAAKSAKTSRSKDPKDRIMNPDLKAWLLDDIA